jgi:glucokinase
VNESPALAVDIGGTKLAVGLVDPGGRVLSVERTPTPTGDDATERIWTALDVLMSRAVNGARLAGVGVGCGGPMTWPDGVVSPLNIPSWRDFPLRERLCQRFPGALVRVHNDAICLAAGEHWRGAGRGKDGVLGIVVSTGVGGGLILGGRLIDGASGNAGHIGHVVVDPNGPECACGGRGCLEAIARGPAIADWARENGWEMPAGTARDVADDAARGHPAAIGAIRRAGHALGIAIASVTNLLDLQTVTIGGGVSQTGPLLFDALEETLRRHARMGYAREVSVVPTELGQQAGLVGAAALVHAGDRYWSAP